MNNYEITEAFGSYQMKIGDNMFFYEVPKQIVDIIKNLEKQNEKLKQLNEEIEQHIDGFGSTNHYGCNDGILELLDDFKNIINK